ncbi:hypothetical protein I7I53_03978 [Histoplasma capsulatum var. duboisii H88]|uniref:Uncharacterized protein n=1 Tax=Ajellomyces capsulatus (strain H88) TaxID=544711 RepID=A0A8A1LNT0_AJEC8|nr:hypothetical protein I7I53_03978 [Histoplasma capsulatum var. duboisii H88]
MTITIHGPGWNLVLFCCMQPVRKHLDAIILWPMGRMRNTREDRQKKNMGISLFCFWFCFLFLYLLFPLEVK